MIKLKSILNEGYSWERKADGSLPTLADSIAAYEAKLREEAELNMPFGDNDEDADSKMVDESEKPDYIDADGDGNEKESMKKAFADKEKSASYKTQVLWDADMKELQKDIKKIKQQHSKVEVSAVTRKGNGHQVTVKIFQDDTNESINELSDKEIDARWNTPQQRWQRQFNTSQMANDTKSSNVPNSGKSVEKAPSNFYREKLVALKAQRKQIEFDMEQEAEPEGGPIADYYGEALMHVDAQIEAIKDKMHTIESTLIKKA